MKVTLEAINQAIAALFFICYAYQFVYIPIALFRKKKRLPAAAPHRYAVLIAARNEEAVIGDLLDSLHRQDCRHCRRKGRRGLYPGEPPAGGQGLCLGGTAGAYPL